MSFKKEPHLIFFQILSFPTSQLLCSFFECLEHFNTHCSDELLVGHHYCSFSLTMLIKLWEDKTKYSTSLDIPGMCPWITNLS